MSMALLLSKSELSQTEPAERAAFNSPVPTQIVSNGEFNPLPQTQQQRRVEERIKEIADTIAEARPRPTPISEPQPGRHHCMRRPAAISPMGTWPTAPEVGQRHW